MDLEKRIKEFLELNHKNRLDSWKELLLIGEEFVGLKSDNQSLAKVIADAILDHRSLMGSSKAYESATEIDLALCEVCTPIDRIAYKNSRLLIEFLKSDLYYSNYYPEKFNKSLLENEIKALQNKALNCL